MTTQYAADEDGAAPIGSGFSPLAPEFAVIYGPYVYGGGTGFYVAHDSHADAIASGRRGDGYRVIARGLTWAAAQRRRQAEARA